MRHHAAILLAVCSACVGACGSKGGRANTEDGPGSLVIEPDALRATKLLVHPLTRIGVGRDGAATLILHLELRDRFDQPVKALGRVEVGLYKPVESAGAGRGDTSSRQDKSWTIDLTDAKANADAYDNLVTRTYTLYLGSLPDWLLSWKTAAPTDDVGRLAPAIEVVFSTADSTGSEYTLRASHRLRR